MKKILLTLLLLPSIALSDFRYRPADATSVIEDSMCIPELNGEGFLHVDEDVSGLKVIVYGSNGAVVATYDAGTEIEDISAIGTYAAPTAGNVRVSPQGSECTQMMFTDTVYDSQDWVQITVSDGQTTIMDFTRFVYLGFGGSSDITSATTTALTNFGTATETNVDAVETKVDGVDTVVGSNAADIAAAQLDLDILTGTDGVILDTSQPNYDVLAAVGVIGEEVGENGAGLTTIPWNPAWNAEVESAGGSVLQSTTIATLASQTSFTLTAGSPDDDAYNGQRIVIVDQSTSTQRAVGTIQDYVGSTKTVTLRFDPAIFTMAVGDLVDILTEK